MEILRKRYPDIVFFLSFFPHEKKALPTDAKPLENWLLDQPLEEIEILYLVGLIGFSLPEKILNWLDERKERALVFIEEDLGAFACFSDAHLLENPQIHLHYAQEDVIETLAQMFPNDRLAIFEGKPFDVLGLQRRSAALSALYSDVLYSHRIVDNVITNFRHLTSSFDTRATFKNTPAIICGAGPSLEKSFSALRKIGDKALVFAGGSAIAALTQNQIIPHFSMALDPNKEEFERFKQSLFFEGPFLFAPRLNWRVFSTVNGPLGYLKTDTGGLAENWLEERLGIEIETIGADLNAEAFSVTTMAISYALSLGCNPIILTGVDLSYQSGKRYPEGVEAEAIDPNDPRALEKPLNRIDIYGHRVKTLLKWVMEASAISALAKEHPNVQFLNATEGGLGFQGIKNISLDQALEGKESKDLLGELHQWIQMNAFSSKVDELPTLLQRLGNSLEKCALLCKSILQELDKKADGARLALYKSDFEEEEAYQCLLEGIDGALDRLLFRYYPHLDPEEGKWEREKAKYNEIGRQIGEFGTILRRGYTCIR